MGYVATGLKTVRDLAVGDTITWVDEPASQPLPGYQPMKPMVFAGSTPARARTTRCCATRWRSCN